MQETLYRLSIMLLRQECGDRRVPTTLPLA